MPAAPILCIGTQWKASDVYWKGAPRNARLLGSKAKRANLIPANFAHQTGIYILFADYRPIYVGKANGSLYARLQTHYKNDDLVGRWDTFTWFGMRSVTAANSPNPGLSNNTSDFHIGREQLLKHFEGAMIHAFEPPLNSQDGKFGKQVIRYRQVRDPRLGPSDRGLAEMIAMNGGLLANGPKPTKTGWR